MGYLMSVDKKVLTDINEVCYSMASQLLRVANDAIDDRGEFNIFLSGGSTPRQLYKLLASPNYSNLLPWGKMHIFFGDERCVPTDHPDSNYKMANEALFKYVNLDPTHIHRIPSEYSPVEAAKNYHITLKALLPKDSEGNVIADLILLGLGEDGHTASLFPDTEILDVKDENAAAIYIEKIDTWRISITYPVINNARNIWFMVTGANKQKIVDRIFYHPSETDPLPVERIKPKGDVVWYLDRDASSWAG